MGCNETSNTRAAADQDSFDYTIYVFIQRMQQLVLVVIFSFFLLVILFVLHC